MLIDVTNTDTLIRPQDAESFELIQSAKKQLGNVRFSKCCKIIDKELDRLTELGESKNKLVFTKAGFMVGRSPSAPEDDVTYIWDSAEIAYPALISENHYDEIAIETQLKFVGGFVRWRISLRDETWLVYRQPSGKYNKHTGREITVSEYWVNDDFVFSPTPKRKNTIQDLARKFGSSREL